MELRHLKYFVTVVNEKHFSRAAEKLHLVQPALSMQIRDMEQELGTTLLRRTTRNIELTEAGALFYDEAVRTLEQADRAIYIAKRAGKGLIGTIRIGYAGNAILSGILPKKLRRYRRDYPDVEVELLETPLMKCAQAILEDRLDVCFMPSFLDKAPTGLACRKLADFPWIIAMASSHPLTKYFSLTAGMLRNESFILYSGPKATNGHGAVLQRLMGRHLKVAYKSANAFSVIALATAGYGITLLPGSYLSVYIPRLTYRLIRNFKERSDITLYYRVNEDRPVVNAFINSANTEEDSFGT